MEDKKHKKVTLLRVLGYIFGALFILTGVFGIFVFGFMTGLLYTLSGLTIFPPFWKFVYDKYNISFSRPLKIVTFLVLIVLTGASFSGSDLLDESESYKEGNEKAKELVEDKLEKEKMEQVSQEPVENTEETEAAETKEEKSSIPAEYKSALFQAHTYANSMHMSKQGLYDQLVSEYGGQFSKEAAQYAIDNVEADWNANALEKAKTYQDDMHLSPNAIHDQLTSPYGEKFTQEEADYAIQHLND